MKKTAAVASTNEQLLERIEAEIALARGLAGPMPANVVVSEVKKAEAGHDPVIRLC